MEVNSSEFFINIKKFVLTINKHGVIKSFELLNLIGKVGNKIIKCLYVFLS